MEPEQIKEMVRGWMSSNRKGADANNPCYWTITGINTIGNVPAKNIAPNAENLTVSDIDESAEYLLDCMSYSVHFKAFYVRLRKEKGDVGITNSFYNPYYNKPSVYGIGNVPQDNNMSMTFIGMLQQQNEERIKLREQSLMLTVQNMQNQHAMDMKQLKKDIKTEAEIKELKQQIKDLENSKTSVIAGIWDEVKPEISAILKHGLSGYVPYPDKVEKLGEHAEDTQYIEEEERPSNYTQKGMDLLKKRVGRPDELVFKLGVVLKNISDDEASQMLSMLETKYQEIKKNTSENG